MPMDWIIYAILFILVILLGTYYKKLQQQKIFLEEHFNQKYRNNSVLRSYDTYNQSYNNLVKKNDVLQTNIVNNRYGSYYDTIYSNFFRLNKDSEKLVPEINRRAGILETNTNNFKQEVAKDSGFIDKNKNQIIDKYNKQTDKTFSNLNKPDNQNITVIPSETSNMMGYRGKFGTIYQISVTGSTRGGTVWGTDTYTDDSHIPMAAVHAGVIPVGQTTDVFIEMMNAQNSYSGTSRNGVQTHNYGYWGGTYKFIKPDISIKNTVEKLFKKHLVPSVGDYAANLSNNSEATNGINNSYNNGLQKTSGILNGQEISFLQRMESDVKQALNNKKKTIPSQDISNNPGILVRIYTSSTPINDINAFGKLTNEYVVPSINYYMTSAMDSFFNSKKNSSLGIYRYLEFLGNISIPNDAFMLEFKLESAVGSRLYFAGSLVIDDFQPNRAVDINSSVNYVVGGQKVPFKLQAIEGLDNTNSYIILKWRINQKGSYNPIPIEYYFLPNIKPNFKQN